MDVQSYLENYLQKDIFVQQKNLLRCFGISLEKEQSLFYRIYSSSLLFFMTTIPFVQIYTIIIYIYDVDILIEILTFPLFTITVGIQLVIILKNKDNLRENLEKFECGVFLPKLKRGGLLEYSLIKECTTSVNKLVKICVAGVVVVSISMIGVCICISALAEDCHDWQFVFGPILNVTCTPYIYPIYIYQTTIMICYGFSYVAIFLLFITILMHLRCHFRSLQNAIGRMIKNAKTELLVRDYTETGFHHEEQLDYDGLVPWSNLKKSLKGIITYHESILDLAEDFKKLFSPILLMLFLADLFLLGLMMIFVLECPTESVKCSRGILCYTVLIALLFVVTYWGNQISVESENVAKVCSEINFIDVDPRFQKCLLLIIQRSQKPLMFTAGGFVDLSLHAFTQILRSSYSYFMVLYHAKGT